MTLSDVKQLLSLSVKSRLSRFEATEGSWLCFSEFSSHSQMCIDSYLCQVCHYRCFCRCVWWISQIALAQRLTLSQHCQLQAFQAFCVRKLFDELIAECFCVWRGTLKSFIRQSERFFSAVLTEQIRSSLWLLFRSFLNEQEQMMITFKDALIDTVCDKRLTDSVRWSRLLLVKSSEL